MSLLIAKAGVSGAATGIRRILLRNQALTVYDVWGVLWTAQNNSLAQINEVMMGALSVRPDDQRDDAGSINFLELLQFHGLFAAFALVSDLETNGALAVVSTLPIMFPKAIRVTQLAMVLQLATAIAGNMGVEVYFERVRVSAIEQAEVQAQTGGRIETS